MTRALSHPAFRFAPSPNGYLHLGHAFSALENERLARASGGRLFLRIEDIDKDRCRPEYERAIIEELRWLGIPFDPEIRRQSHHLADYAQALVRLERKGILYPCFCSRSDIVQRVREKPDWPRDPDGSPLYPGICRHMSREQRQKRLAAGDTPAYRIDIERATALVGGGVSWLDYGSGSEGRLVTADPRKWGDTILARRDIGTSYHIAVVVDDASQGITDIVRGEDLFHATSLHRLLQSLLDLPGPVYHHHALLRDGAGQKLSKSLRAKSLRSLREEGLTPEMVRTRLVPAPSMVTELQNV